MAMKLSGMVISALIFAAGCDLFKRASEVHFQDNGDGTIMDSAVNKMWQKADSGMLLQWEAAGAYCDRLELAGHDDWHLPHRDELIGLYNRLEASANYAADRMVPPFEWTSSPYWSSMLSESDLGYAWFVLFYSGNVYPSSKTNGYYARCIR